MAKRKTVKAKAKTNTQRRKRRAAEVLGEMNPFNGIAAALQESTPKATIELYDARTDAIAAIARAVETNNETLQALATHLTSAPNYQRAHQILR